MSTREEIESLLEMNEYIDLIIPRGSNELVSMIQKQSQGIPVLGHSEGVCHVYIDKNIDQDMALDIGKPNLYILLGQYLYCIFKKVETLV